MKKTLKKTTLALLITSAISSFTYASTVVDVDGSFTIADVDGITLSNSSDIKAKVDALLADSSLNQVELDSSSTVDSDENYYTLDGNGNRVTRNSVLKVTGNPYGLTGNINGAYCHSTTSDCEIENSNVVISDSVIAPSDVYGAYSSDSATGDVYLMDSAQVNGNVHGANSSSYLYSTSATGNAYLMDSAQVAGNAYGAYSFSSSFSPNYTSASSASATGNAYLIDSAQVNGNVYGAYSYSYSDSSTSSSSATGNVYLMGGALVAGDVYGAYSSSSSYSSTTGNVYLIDSAQVNGNVYGAYSYFDSSSSYSYSYFSATGNAYIYGNVKLQDSSQLYGVYLDHLSTYYSVFNNNLLSIGNAAITVSSMGNFENYRFYLNDYNQSDISSGTALITVTDSMLNNDTVINDGSGGTETTTNKSNIQIAGISGEDIISTGDTITLIDASSATSFTGGDNTGKINGLFNSPNDNTVNVGLVSKANISYTVDAENNKIIATIDDIYTSNDSVEINVKPLAEGRLAGLQNVLRGADLLLDVFGPNETIGSFTPIALISGGVNKYQSGSHIDSRDYRLMIGSRYQALDNLYIGVAAEYGRSNYDTYNSFSGSEVNGDGHSYNYGLSLFARYSDSLALGDIYFDGALRFGRTDTEFNSSDIVMGNGDTAYYKSKVNYLGAQVGMGFIYPVNDVHSFDSSVRYLWTRLGSDSVLLDGDKVNFDKSTSSRVQLKEQYNYASTDNLTFSLAGIYEYEFNSDVSARVSGIGIDAPSVKGSTGIMELGIKGTPIEDNKDFSVNVKFRGYSGKHDGISASAIAEYRF